MDMNTILVMRSMLIYQAQEILSARKDGKKEVREQEEEEEAGEKERSQLLGQRQTAAAIGQVVCGGKRDSLAPPESVETSWENAPLIMKVKHGPPGW